MTTLIDKVKSTIFKHGMLQSGDRVIVGVSGGPDSILLLHVLNSLKKGFDTTLFVGHLNHLLRAEGTKEAEFVKKTAQALGIPFFSIERDIKKLAKKRGRSIEETGRHERMQFFTDLSERLSATKIALGHQRDDQVETILMWLIRGCGPRGMLGMPASRSISQGLAIIRPLIELEKKEIIAYLKENGIQYLTDQSNLQPLHVRNKIRLKILPDFLSINPDFKEKVIGLSKLVAEDEDYILQGVRRWKERVLIKQNEREVLILRKEISSAPPSIKRRLLRKFIEEVKGDCLGISSPHIDSILHLITGRRPNARLDLPYGMVVLREYDTLRISKGPFFKEEPLEFLYRIDPEGSTDIPEVSGRLEMRISKNIPQDLKGDNFEVWLDWKRIEPPIVLRNRRVGDSFHPLGVRGKKKVKDLFIDRKVPLKERAKIPLLEDRNGIIWVIGFQIDERVQITPTTQEALHAIFRTY
jgi:tRNA(Ile)-lysidine synthase